MPYALLAITWSNVWIVLAILFFLFLSVLLMLAVLIQKPQGGGLAGAFGSGAGSGQTAFGANTGDALTVATIAIFVVWLLCAVGLNYGMRPASATPVPAAIDSKGPGTPADSKPASSSP